ncbi:efflux RND transporter periplasmic adaptor subunit [Halomonas sp. BM-2019]|uniref:efflux RND transporter periplasmic adaptor subunit n=1 Tax=Halomonas sp. BM-2019 TaxID=2811227 RepID=UPI001B3C21A9|nr:MAG: efflux RND transporter periplasmic adaptor subunit [Halomonas sp. BM-2019]
MPVRLPERINLDMRSASRLAGSVWSAGAAICLVMLAACSGPPEAPREAPRIVESIVLGAPERPPIRQFPGEVRADQRAELSFRVSGPLLQLPIQEGQLVAAGQLLARIDPRDFETERQWREAEFLESRALSERVARAFGSGAVTAAERDQVQARFEVAAAELALAENTLADTELRAPFSGRVARRLVENFQTVQAGQPVLILEDISRLEVRTQLPEQDIVTLPPDVPMLGTVVGQVYFEALPGRAFPATVKEFDTRADAQTNTYRVVLSLARPDEGNILPGMSGNFVPGYAVATTRRVHFLPVEAIQATPDGRAFVWLLDSTGQTVQQRLVLNGQLSGQQIEILEGLQTGDRVVTLGGAYLAEGMTVRTGQ